jgi:hypothetical protein
MDGDWVTLIEEVRDQENADLLLRAVVDILALKVVAPDPHPRHLMLWNCLRPLFGVGTLTPARMVSAFLLADHLVVP